MPDTQSHLRVDIHTLIDDWQPGPWDDLKMLLHFIVDPDYQPPEPTESPSDDDDPTVKKET